MTTASLKIELDTSSLDAALEKVERLRAALDAIKAEIEPGPITINITMARGTALPDGFAEEIERAIKDAARPAARKFKL